MPIKITIHSIDTNSEDTESIHLGGYTYFDTTLGPIGGIDDRRG
jgi:hypothetical protein